MVVRASERAKERERDRARWYGRSPSAQHNQHCVYATLLRFEFPWLHLPPSLCHSIDIADNAIKLSKYFWGHYSARSLLWLNLILFLLVASFVIFFFLIFQFFSRFYLAVSTLRLRVLRPLFSIFSCFRHISPLHGLVLLAVVGLLLFCFWLSRLDYKCLANVFTIVGCWSCCYPSTPESFPHPIRWSSVMSFAAVLGLSQVSWTVGGVLQNNRFTFFVLKSSMSKYYLLANIVQISCQVHLCICCIIFAAILYMALINQS